MNVFLVSGTPLDRASATGLSFPGRCLKRSMNSCMSSSHLQRRFEDKVIFVVDHRSPWCGEGGRMDEEMTELERTESDVIEEITGNRRCGTGCGRPGAGERNRADTRQKQIPGVGPE